MLVIGPVKKVDTSAKIRWCSAPESTGILVISYVVKSSAKCTVWCLLFAVCSTLCCIV